MALALFFVGLVLALGGFVSLVINLTKEWAAAEEEWEKASQAFQKEFNEFGRRVWQTPLDPFDMSQNTDPFFNSVTHFMRNTKKSKILFAYDMILMAIGVAMMITSIYLEGMNLLEQLIQIL